MASPQSPNQPNAPYLPPYPYPPQMMYPPGYHPPPAMPMWNGFSIAGFVLGLVCTPLILFDAYTLFRYLRLAADSLRGLLLLGNSVLELLFAILPASIAIVFGAIGATQTRRAPARFIPASRGMSWWGVCLGITALVLPIISFAIGHIIDRGL